MTQIRDLREKDHTAFLITVLVTTVGTNTSTASAASLIFDGLRDHEFAEVEEMSVRRLTANELRKRREELT